jgi:putative MATE family efflux protein
MYNVIDLFWVGHIGTDAVAAVGTATFFINLGWAIASIVTIGASIKISQAVGAQDKELSKRYASAALVAATVIGLLYTALLLLFPTQLIAFFEIPSAWANEQAVSYLRISALGVILSFLNLIFTAILNAHGKTKLSLKAVLYGNIINILLDPLFIIILDGGVAGAAWATVGSRMASLLYFYLIIYKGKLIEISFKEMLGRDFKQLLKVGVPSATQRILFTLIAIIMGRIVAEWGTEGIAAQKVGLQIEAISFMIIGGMQQAVSIIVGQSYGARKYERIQILYLSALKIVGCVGVITTILFLTIPALLVGLFVSDPTTVEIGKSYLQIVGLSQLFMCLEMVTGGVYNGQGLTKYSASISVVFTMLRIPLALYLANYTPLGITGVWWSIALTSMIKGVVSATLYRRRTKQLQEMQEREDLKVSTALNT